jgi:hypothetical protein
MIQSPLIRSILLASILLNFAVLPEGRAQRRNPNTPNQGGNSDVTPQPVRTGELRKIDSKADKVETQFVKDAFELSREYENAGDLERAIEYLEAMLKIKPNLPGARERIEKLQNDIISKNDFTFDLDPSGLWNKPVAYVRKDKPFRIQVAGSYKLTVNDSVGPDGYPAGDLQREMLEGINTGQLAGMIVTNNQPGEPFAIGAERDYTPKENGMLFLKVNVPPASRTSGKLKVRLSGYVLSPDLSNIGK